MVIKASMSTTARGKFRAKRPAEYIGNHDGMAIACRLEAHEASISEARAILETTERPFVNGFACESIFGATSHAALAESLAAFINS